LSPAPTRPHDTPQRHINYWSNLFTFLEEVKRWLSPAKISRVPGLDGDKSSNTGGAYFPLRSKFCINRRSIFF